MPLDSSEEGWEPYAGAGALSGVSGMLMWQSGVLYEWGD